MNINVPSAAESPHCRSGRTAGRKTLNISRITLRHLQARKPRAARSRERGVGRYLIQGVDVWLNTPRRGETHTSTELHDARDAEALVDVLRDEVIPLYDDRDRDALPRRWIARMKRAIRTLGWRFSADRMLTDHVLKAYTAAGGTSSEMRS